MSTQCPRVPTHPTDNTRKGRGGLATLGRVLDDLHHLRTVLAQLNSDQRAILASTIDAASAWTKGVEG